MMSRPTSGSTPPPVNPNDSSHPIWGNNRLLVGLALLIPGVKLCQLGIQLFQEDEQGALLRLISFVLLALVGFAMTDHLIPHIQQYTLRKGISGRDIGKGHHRSNDPEIPEALGIVPGATFICLLVSCCLLTTSESLLQLNSTLLSICFMLFLGFTDDVLDWPWRYKLILPTVASWPLLVCYTGSTYVVIPTPLRSLFSSPTLQYLLETVFRITVESNTLLHLGHWYWLYMSLLAVFCTNAINIYAGINGLEAGQSIVMACFVLVHNVWELQSHSMSSQYHWFSIMILLTFCGVTLALLKHNWYPARVFVGDTFCYFAGMTFAVVGILGHFSKTLLLFFLPQIVNFLWSLPQLAKVVPCPRHRLPFFNPATGCMEPSTFTCKPEEYRWLKRLQRGGSPDATQCPNMTVINLTLQLLGPMSERSLCVTLLVLQALSCAFGMFVRYYVSKFFFDEERTTT